MDAKSFRERTGFDITGMRSPWGWAQFASEPTNLDLELTAVNERRREADLANATLAIEESPRGEFEVTLTWPGGRFYEFHAATLEDAQEAAPYFVEHHYGSSSGRQQALEL